MTGLVLTPRGAFEARVDLSGVLPSVEGDLAKLKIGYGAARAELGELFDVSGAADGRLTIESGGAQLDRVGAGLSSGEIVVKGDVGHQVGQRQSGGVIVVKGSAGDYAASELSGGKIAVAGDVGARLGAAGDGAKRGMSGGVVVIGGSAGARAGERLRGGVVLIEGDAAEGAGTSMIAGTLAVMGRLGRHAGRGMKRGTLFVSSPEELASGFADAGEHDLVMLRVLARRSHELAHLFGGRTRARRFAGDLTLGGKGEALILSR
ncbi:formylmethanofuran dehydrogenase subunit C [Chelatococcus sambhunathii]|uniref:Formylmethanofuran dehydrogenase subunit C n=1 Tax=Chelatococcus sambhunathii TaxID=363953 RepID=A0ABU1DIG9_9HYPH|nr:formylmethanofuran dehydrogenase subunit C [Chelatococcus sambhunathii]MDR4307828.1 formylmethanofuran dehydrogenase subunit C [Chelatococcus sambhunathii]